VVIEPSGGVAEVAMGAGRQEGMVLAFKYNETSPSAHDENNKSLVEIRRAARRSCCHPRSTRHQAAYTANRELV